MHPTYIRGKKELIRIGSKRKRALHGHMETWARATTRFPSGIIGEAGERVARASFDAAAPYGIRPVQPGAVQITRLFADPVPGGPLDYAVWVDQLDDWGRSTGSILCPVEVKNIRHWIYPRSHELFQLLHKAAMIQQERPEIDVCPVLITRKRSWTADQKSRDLGLRIFDLHKQFILPIADVPDDRVDAVRDELGYVDLTRSDTADPTLTTLAQRSLRSTARANAERWKEYGSNLAEHYEVLRQANLSEKRRETAMNELREAADENGSYTRPW